MLPTNDHALDVRVDGREQQRGLDVLLSLHQAQRKFLSHACLEVGAFRADGHAVTVHAEEGGKEGGREGGRVSR